MIASFLPASVILNLNIVCCKGAALKDSRHSSGCEVVSTNDCWNVSFLLLADEEFDELCFEFGLELDEIVSNLH